MITVHAIRLETAPALLLLKDGRDAVAVINNRLDVETLLQALYTGAEVLWPHTEPPAAEPTKAPRSWGCQLGDDCTCWANDVAPLIEDNNGHICALFRGYHRDQA